MAENPVPPPSTAEDTETPPLPTNAEDRKAAAALSNLDRPDSNAPASAAKIDEAAVRKAMARLDVNARENSAEVTKKEGEKREGKRVKVDAGDVLILMQETETTKVKATEILKSYDADLDKCLKAWVVGEW